MMVLKVSRCGIRKNAALIMRYATVPCGAIRFPARARLLGAFSVITRTVLYRKTQWERYGLEVRSVLEG